MKGSFVISLDFELFWGVFDNITIDKFGNKVLMARKVIPELLKLFKKYNIHVTWGIVGMLFLDNISEIGNYFPEIMPEYTNPKLSAYNYLKNVDLNEKEDVYYCASSLVDLIGQYDNQEIASHTFSHYYCKEQGQDAESFKYDLLNAQKIALKKNNLVLKSLILPRNQFIDEYVPIIKSCGFSSVRGNQNHYAYNNSNLIARAIRLIDSYVNICGMKCYKKSECLYDGIAVIKASRFFRPYSNKLRFLEKLKINCIKRQMKYAAKNGRIFHLWWHPHNFGANSDINLNQLEEILIYYSKLKQEYGFLSKNMNELAGEILE